MSDVEREIEVEEAEAVAEAVEESGAPAEAAAEVAEEPEAAGMSREEIKRNMATNMREKAARLKG